MKDKHFWEMFCPTLRWTFSTSFYERWTKVVISRKRKIICNIVCDPPEFQWIRTLNIFCWANFTFKHKMRKERSLENTQYSIFEIAVVTIDVDSYRSSNRAIPVKYFHLINPGNIFRSDLVFGVRWDGLEWAHLPLLFNGIYPHLKEEKWNEMKWGDDKDKERSGSVLE